jgi:predicted HicB family RNase H-like nuclease
MKKENNKQTLTVRLPRELHFKAKGKACEERRTLQSVIVELLSTYVHDVSNK